VLSGYCNWRTAVTLAGVQPPCVKPWACRLGADLEGHRGTIVRRARIIICKNNLVMHRDDVETMRGGIIWGGKREKNGKLFRAGSSFTVEQPCLAVLRRLDCVLEPIKRPCWPRIRPAPRPKSTKVCSSSPRPHCSARPPLP
jgi:hypothetical protein